MASLIDNMSAQRLSLVWASVSRFSSAAASPFGADGWLNRLVPNDQNHLRPPEAFQSFTGLKRRCYSAPCLAGIGAMSVALSRSSFVVKR